MELHEILNAIKSTGNMQKTAAAVPSSKEKIATTKDKLLNALDSALQSEKTAASASPVTASATNEIAKIAQDLANSEAEALQKEAYLYGAAVADGFMARLRQYEQATAGMQPTTKLAYSETPTPEEFEKFAAENPELVKQAIELGYHHGKLQIEQLKQAAFEQGYLDAKAQIEELEKTAEGRETLAKIASEVSAENDIANMLEKLAETPEGREKLAEIKRGYDDTMKEITKLAAEVYERGYNDTINVLKAL